MTAPAQPPRDDRREFEVMELGLLAVLAVLLSPEVVRAELFAGRAFRPLLAFFLAATVGMLAFATRGRGTLPALLFSYLCWTASLLLVGGGGALQDAQVSLLFFGVFALVAGQARPGSGLAFPVTLMSAVVLGTALLDALGVLVFFSDRRPGGLLGNRNFASELVVLVLPLLALLEPRRSWRALLSFAGGMILLWSRCRTAWIAAAISQFALLATVAADRKTRPLALESFLSMVCGALLASLIPAELVWSEPDPYLSSAARLLELDTGSGALRVAQWRAGLRELGQGWGWLLGAGQGGWPSIARGNDLPANAIPHSDLLRILVESGLPGAVAMAAVVLTAMLVAWRARRPAHFAFLIALAVIAIADAPLFRPEVSFLFVLVLGDLKPLVASPAAAEPSSIPKAERARWYVLLVALALAITHYAARRILPALS